MIKLQKLFQKLPQFNIVDEANGLYLHMSGMSWEPRKSHYLWRGPEQLAQNMMAKLQHPTAIMVPVGSTVDVVGGPEPE